MVRTFTSFFFFRFRNSFASERKHMIGIEEKTQIYVSIDRYLYMNIYMCPYDTLFFLVGLSCSFFVCCFPLEMTIRCRKTRCLAESAWMRLLAFSEKVKLLPVCWDGGIQHQRYQLVLTPFSPSGVKGDHRLWDQLNFLLKMGDVPASHVSFLGCKSQISKISKRQIYIQREKTKFHDD